MTLLEFNEELVRNEFKGVKKANKEYHKVTDDDIEEFVDILAMGDSMMQVFKNGSSAEEFLKVFPSVLGIMEKPRFIETYYVCKLGANYPGMPHKLIYLVKTAVKECESKYINMAIHRCLTDINFNLTGVTLPYNKELNPLEVIEAILGRKVDLITTSNLSVNCGDSYEVYITKADKVAILPEDIAKSLNFEDIQDIELDPKIGLVLNDVPLRTLGGRIGITLDDLNLTACV